jgi:ascorbate PTS system EIIB component
LIKISAVCGMGLGSGLLVKMGIERVLERHGFGRKDFRVEVADISTARATTPDIFVTTSEFAKSLREVDAEVIVVKNLFNETEIEEALLDTFKKVYETKNK